MKRNLLLIATLICVAVANAADGDEFEYNGLNYEVISEENHEVRVSKNENISGVIEIPSYVVNGSSRYSVTVIVGRAFSNCNGLTSVTIPNSVAVIGECTFAGCTGLTSVTIPNSVTEIGEAAFSNCNSLTSVTIPNSMAVIREGTFAGCTGLTSVTIPNSVTEIGETAFRDCDGLTSVSIPNSVIEIGDSAFFYCSGLTSVTIPNSVTVIGWGAFLWCRGLTSVAIPNSVTLIDGETFSECSGLTSVTIPNSVTELGWSAFSGCSSLESVVIPASVAEIITFTFSGCVKLTKIYNLNPTPQTLGEYVFKDVPADAVVYVPKGSSKEYAEADGWNYFTDFREMGAFDITMSNEAVELAVGETVTLKAEVTKDADMTVKSNEWTSSNPAVATVDQAGKVTAIAPGQAVIYFTATDGYGVPHAESCKVTVNESSAIEDITIEPTLPWGVYTISGIRVANTTDNLPAGIYIVRQGNVAKKIAVK